MKVLDRYSGEEIGETECESVPSKVQILSNEAMASLQTMERKDIMMAFARLVTILDQRRMEVALLISRESGKPLKFCMKDVEKASQVFHYWSVAKRLESSSMSTFSASEITIHREWLLRETRRGPVLLVTNPLNAFLETSVWFGELASEGSPIVVVNPSGPSLVIKDLVEMIHTAGFPKNSLLQADEKCINGMQTLTLPAIRSDSIHPDSAVLVMEGTDPEFSSKEIFKSMLWSGIYGGTKFNRILIEGSESSYFINRMGELAGEIVFGDPKDKDTDFPDRPIFNDHASMSDSISRSVLEGCRVIFGNQATGNGIMGLHFQGGSNKFQISTEINFPAFLFGSVSSYSEAESLLGTLENKFAVSLFTVDLNIAMMAAEKLDFQFIEINDAFDPILGFENYSGPVLDRISSEQYLTEVFPLKRWKNIVIRR